MKHLRIGYCGSENKWKNFRWDEFIQYALLKNVEVVKIDLTIPIENQGKFDLIIHKMSYLMNGHDMNSNLELKTLYEYIKHHSDTILIDDLDSVATTLDRNETTQKLQSINWRIGSKISCPKTLLLEKTDFDSIIQSTHDLKYPILAKPQAASVTQNVSKEFCHTLRVATSPEQLVGFSSPSIIQEYINHNGIVYKIYVLGSQISCQLRASTRNIKKDETLHLDFHSGKPNVENGLWTEPRDFSFVDVPLNDFKEVADDLRENFNLDLLGFDILIDKNGHYWIIDVNYFPAYHEVNDLWTKFLNFFMEKLQLPPR